MTKPMTRQRGFSLLELLVAFAIMAISLGLLYKMAGGSARNVTDAAQNQQAAWLAESLLASRSSVRADGWNEDGESAGFKWQVRSGPYVSAAGPAGTFVPQAVPMHSVKLSINWEAGTRPGQLDVVTLRPERRLQPGEVVR